MSINVTDTKLNHFAVFSNSAETQYALDEGFIENPYVALVGGVLDYDSLEATPSIEYMGEWTENEPNDYTFTILDTEVEWMGVNIGSLNGVYFGGEVDVDIVISKEDEGEGPFYILSFFSEDISEPPMTILPGDDSLAGEGSGVFIQEEASDAEILISWDCDTNAINLTVDGDYDIPITTINPEYPEPEPEE